ncbi:MAG: hypothetical protein ABIR79_11695 [Candidatus Binatia bacterium]
MMQIRMAFLVVLAVAAALVLGRAAAAQVQVEINRPRSIFECDTPIGEKWYGSADRCLRELCAGENVTNAQLVDASGRLRRNPCYGRDPFELQK